MRLRKVDNERANKLCCKYKYGALSEAREGRCQSQSFLRRDSVKSCSRKESAACATAFFVYQLSRANKKTNCWELLHSEMVAPGLIFSNSEQ